jgi:hypothetical protein
MAINWLKVIGVGTTVIGAVASVAGNIVDKKNQEQAAVKAAEEAVAKLMKKES